MPSVDNLYALSELFQVSMDEMLCGNRKKRDREFHYIYRELQKWLCRLAKRIYVSHVLLEIESFNKEIIIKNTEDCYSKMFEFEDGWYEYLLWNEKC